MRSPRANLAITLVVAGVTLIVAIAIGNEMGNRVLGQVTERGPAIAATPVATPVPGGTNAPALYTWKREQVVSVATDPAFPDPRVTPPPPPPPPRYTPAPPKPTLATPTPRPTPTPRLRNLQYTSPPLPLPLVTHTPGPEGESPTGSPPPEATPTGVTSPGP
jgi:hypothetical protein